MNIKPNCFSAITDKAGAGVAKSSLVQAGQILHQARSGVVGHSVERILFFTVLVASSHYEVVTNLDTTGSTAV